MCKVSATRYPRRHCHRKFRVEEACKRGFSSSKLSCRERHNEIIRATIAKELVCFPCYTGMEARIREEYKRRVQLTFDEGMSTQLERKKIVKACKQLRKGESADIAILREQCGIGKWDALLFPPPTAMETVKEFWLDLEAFQACKSVRKRPALDVPLDMDLVRVVIAIYFRKKQWRSFAIPVR